MTSDAATTPLTGSTAVEQRFERELGLAQRLLDDHLVLAVDRFGAAALDIIDLPSVATTPGELEPAQIRAAGILLWASEVEAAGLLGFVDALAQGMMEGKVLIPIAAGADRVMLYWHARRERFAPEERRALYQRLFGRDSDPQHPFASSFKRLLTALDFLAHAEVDVNLTGPLARVNAAARDTAEWLSLHAGGVANFAARSIMGQIRDALLVLQDPTVVAALGGGSPWRLLQSRAPQILGRSLDPLPHLDRAGAAIVLTGWLAAAAQAIGAGTASTPPPQVLNAAERWLTAGVDGV